MYKMVCIQKIYIKLFVLLYCIPLYAIDLQEVIKMALNNNYQLENKKYLIRHSHTVISQKSIMFVLS